MRIAQFGVFELDAAAQELRKGGIRIRLQQQPFQVLAILVERAGEVVTREELRDRLWAVDTFVEFDQSLNTAIKKIRAALSDPAVIPRFVETVPRRGYRFIAPVRRIEAPADSASPATPMPDPAQVPASRARRWPTIAAVGLVTILGASLLAWVFVQAPTRTAPLSLNPVPLTSYPGSEIHPSFSPDGTRVAFSWTGDGEDNYDIYIKLLNAEKPLRLTQDPADDLSPAWSPDAQRIAFLRFLPGQSASVFAVSALGGPARELTKLHFSRRRVPGFEDAFWADAGPYLCWSQDGRFLVVPDQPSDRDPFGLFALVVETGKMHRLTSSTQPDTQPSISPDGRTIAFVRSIGVGVSEIHLLQISEQMEPLAEVRRLTFEKRSVQGPTWSRDGRSVIFSSGLMVGSRRLWRIPVSARAQAELLLGPADMASSPTVARGAARMAYSQQTADYNVWRIELPAGNRMAGEPHPLISSTYIEKQPQFSPDGKRIAFASNRSGTEELWVCDADGFNPMQLTSFRGPATGAPRWSPDGRQIAFDAFRKGIGDIFVVPSGGGAAAPLTNDDYIDAHPSWSHDGRWIYYASLRSGRYEIWKMPSPAAKPVGAIQVTGNGGANPFETSDGEFLYFTRRGALWRVPVHGGQETRVIDSIMGGGGFALAKDGIYFFAKKNPGDETTLRFLPFPSGRTRHIASIGNLDVNHLAVSPDGRWIIYLQRDREDSDLMLVENYE